MKFLKPIFEEWLSAIYWRSHLLRIFIIKKRVEFSLKSLDTWEEKYSKIVEIFSFLPLIKNSVTIWLSYLLLIILKITSQMAINTLHFLFWL